MANMKQVNKAIKSEFPNLQIEVVRGDGYVYFDGAHGFDVIDSIYSHPVSTDTGVMWTLVYNAILEVYPNGDVENVVTP